MTNFKWTAFALLGGTVLAPLSANGQTFTTIHAFHNKGQNPYAEVMNVGKHLFGTTYGGGTSNGGTVYRIQLAAGNGETTFQNFTGGVDGEQPIAGLIRVGKSLYGVTDNGAAGCGTAFKVDLTGANFTVLHTFSDSDAQHPADTLIYSGGNFYGTSQSGGPAEAGTVFKMDTLGNLTVLYAFTAAADGGVPYGGLIKIGPYLYGTTELRGVAGQGNGTVFRVKTDGSHFQVLHAFADGVDGSKPTSALVSFQGSLFGVTANGGDSGHGTVFRIDPDGSNYSVVHSFAGGPDDGRTPIGGLLAVGSPGSAPDTLFGTTANGGSTDNGTVFKIDSSGVESMLYPLGAGADGAIPEAALINVPDSDGTTHLYGTTLYGGQWGYGTVFEFTP